MLAKRIIPCLDVKEGVVVKGVQFQNHTMVGDILDLAKYYSQTGADELVFYDITASSESRRVDKTWVNTLAKYINIPFCVAGGIRTPNDAEDILKAGADKIAINSPALENPNLINKLVSTFGQQCIVIGIDSKQIGNEHYICQYTGHVTTTQITKIKTLEWINEVQDRGAGEIVLNCMDSDGVKQGYDIEYLQHIREATHIPLIASGGAGEMSDFLNVFQKAKVDGALAASIFHSKKVQINNLKQHLLQKGIRVRL